MIDSYTSLVAAIVDRMNDAAMESQAPEFIQFAEAMFNRRLTTLDMEGTATIAADATIPLPTDYKGSMSLRIDDDRPLRQLSADDFQDKWSEASDGRPVNFTIVSGAIQLGPAPDAAYTVTMTYLRRLAPLSATNASNWLLEAHPDLYLYASLIEAEMRGWNDERFPLLNGRVEGMIQEINLYDARRRRGNYFDTVAAEYF